MPITIFTDQASTLLDVIYEKMEAYKIRTWKSKKYNRKDVFWYMAAQYEGVAYLLPKATSNKLVLDIYSTDGYALDDSITGVYFGRFVQMITGHFYGQYGITNITIE